MSQKGVTVVRHPLVQHHVTRLRDHCTQSPEFRRALKELTLLLLHEATRSFAVQPARVNTPLAETRGFRLKREVLLVPVLRAGLGMMDSALQFIPDARVGFIGVKRDETTFRAAVYHNSLPADIGPFEIILLDPMLATGGSAVAAMDLIRQHGGRRVRMVNVIAAPEGIRRVRASYPRLPLFTGAIDRTLNAKAYIVPGLGDAGDRLFGA